MTAQDMFIPRLLNNSVACRSKRYWRIIIYNTEFLNWIQACSSLYRACFRHTRTECACFITGDIGQYNTCGHLCRYCYANADAATVRRNMPLHDPMSPLLIGKIRQEDKIHDAKQVSWIDPQMRFVFSQELPSSV